MSLVNLTKDLVTAHQQVMQVAVTHVQRQESWLRHFSDFILGDSGYPVTTLILQEPILSGIPMVGSVFRVLSFYRQVLDLVEYVQGRGADVHKVIIPSVYVELLWIATPTVIALLCTFSVIQMVTALWKYSSGQVLLDEEYVYSSDENSYEEDLPGYPNEEDSLDEDLADFIEQVLSSFTKADPRGIKGKDPEISGKNRAAKVSGDFRMDAGVMTGVLNKPERKEVAPGAKKSNVVQTEGKGIPDAAIQLLLEFDKELLELVKTGLTNVTTVLLNKVEQQDDLIRLLLSEMFKNLVSDLHGNPGVSEEDGHLNEMEAKHLANLSSHLSDLDDEKITEEVKKDLLHLSKSLLGDLVRKGLAELAMKDLTELARKLQDLGEKEVLAQMTTKGLAAKRKLTERIFGLHDKQEKLIDSARKGLADIAQEIISDLSKQDLAHMAKIQLTDLFARLLASLDGLAVVKSIRMLLVHLAKGLAAAVNMDKRNLAKMARYCLSSIAKTIVAELRMDAIELAQIFLSDYLIRLVVQSDNKELTAPMDKSNWTQLAAKLTGDPNITDKEEVLKTFLANLLLQIITNCEEDTVASRENPPHCIGVKRSPLVSPATVRHPCGGWDLPGFGKDVPQDDLRDHETMIRDESQVGQQRPVVPPETEGVHPRPKRYDGFLPFNSEYEGVFPVGQTVTLTVDGASTVTSGSEMSPGEGSERLLYRPRSEKRKRHGTVTCEVRDGVPLDTWWM
ncbi:hypothetical protein OTU49_016099 [Cherax quadricarinatus]|uniref:Uncharacterized protein n=1 Tax=Cherax quadricarinatus TaxID=27406 RepID=A0AAW0XUZ0_CHEQU